MLGTHKNGPENSGPWSNFAASPFSGHRCYFFFFGAAFFFGFAAAFFFVAFFID